MKTNHDEFLLEEYKEAVNTGKWLEEAIAKAFKHLSTFFLWEIALVVFFLRDQKNCDLSIISNVLQGNIIINSFSLLVWIYSYITLINMTQARIGDVQRTSRINFLRKYFLKAMPEDSREEYYGISNERLKEINPIKINKRQFWQLKSDFVLYTFSSAIISSISCGIFMSCICCCCESYTCSIITIGIQNLIIFCSASVLLVNSKSI